MHTYIHTYIHTFWTYLYLQRGTYTHKNIHPQILSVCIIITIHTYIHTYIYKFQLCIYISTFVLQSRLTALASEHSALLAAHDEMKNSLVQITTVCMNTYIHTYIHTYSILSKKFTQHPIDSLRQVYTKKLTYIHTYRS